MVVILVSVKEHDEQNCVDAAHPVAMPGFSYSYPILRSLRQEPAVFFIVEILVATHAVDIAGPVG
jgi:hypothetical protein